MRKSLAIMLICLFSALSLTACSQQNKIDTYEFCKRFNTVYGQEILNSSDYYKSSEKSEYNYFIEVNELRTAVVTLTTNGNSCVSSFQLTVTKNEIELSEDEKKTLTEYFINLSAVINNKTVDDTFEQITQLGFSSDYLGFNSYNLSLSVPESRYTIICNTNIISFYCEKSL